MKIEHEGLTYDVENDSWDVDVLLPDLARYLKGRYRNMQRFDSTFLDYFKVGVQMYDREDRLHVLDTLRTYVKLATGFSYTEAFKIESNSFKAKVFGSINIPEMIKSLGSNLVKVEGLPVKHKVFDDNGDFTIREYDVVYELHKVNLSKISNESTSAYCIKCWCTTTDKEHWLWIEEKYAKLGPLEGIASTIRVYEDMIPHITAILRQGDVLLFEMGKEIIPTGKIVPLTKEQYFRLLISQS